MSASPVPSAPRVIDSCVAGVRLHLLREVKDDRARLEQREVAVLERRDLSERVKRQVCGFLQCLERQQSDLVRAADLLERPPDPGVASEALAAIGRPFECGDDDGHREAPLARPV